MFYAAGRCAGVVAVINDIVYNSSEYHTNVAKFLERLVIMNTGYGSQLARSNFWDHIFVPTAQLF